jgi:ribose 1,5-bisphosphokinase
MMGPLVYVMGPSGAGKDSVLDRARAMMADDLAVAFAHRYITRPADAGGENHVALSPAEFARRRAHGLFALHWHAHGNDYGIGTEIDAWRLAGLTVVVSGSREHFIMATERSADTIPVLITAPAERLQARLAERGREDAAAVTERLRRGLAYDLDVPGLVTIVNDGALDDAARAFVRLLATLRQPARGDRRRAGSAPAP